MKGKADKVMLIAITVLCVFYFFMGLIYRPVVCSDALDGMLSLRNYLNGGEWNKILSLTKDGQLITYNLTWWTPGQYQIPYFFSRLCFVNIGTAIIILMFISACGGCYFYYKLFKISGLKSTLVLCSLLILLLQRFINIYFLQYNSSDLLLFFYTPFYAFIYYCMAKGYPHRAILKLALLTLVNLVGLYIKSSFILFETALNVFLVAEYCYYKRDKISKIQASLFNRSFLLLPFALANFLNYWFFLRLGNNPSQSHGLLFSASNVLAGLFSPVIQVPFASLSLYSIYGNFYNKINLNETIINILIVITLLLAAYVIYRKRSSIGLLFNKDIAFRFTLIASIMYVLFWFAFQVNQSSISNEDRLYLPITILVFPYLLDFAANSRSKLKYIYFGLIGFSVLFGIASFAFRVKNYNTGNSVFSKDKTLNGFKILSNNRDTDPDLQKISNLITRTYKADYIVVSNFDLAFELSVGNKFIKNQTETVPVSKHSVNFVVLVQAGTDVAPTGLQKVFTSGKFSLYRSN